MDGWELVEQMESLDSLASQDMSQMTLLAEMLYNFTECLQVSFEAVPTEYELVKQAMELRETRRLLAGK